MFLLCVFIPQIVIYQSAISISKHTRQMIHAYCTVTMRHIAHSHWQALIYNSQMTWGWEQMAKCILEIHHLSMRLLHWLYTIFIHFMWSWRHLLVYLINLYSHRNSLRHVSHHPFRCTNLHFFADPTFNYDGLLLS